MAHQNLDDLISISDDSTTLLLVDESDNEFSREIFLHSSNYVVLDADILAKKRSMQKKSVAFLLKEARTLLIYAMTHGKILVVRMSDSKTDFLYTFCDECCDSIEKESKYPPYKTLSYLPRDFLLKSGSLMTTSEFVANLFHREDMHEINNNQNFELNLAKFKVIVTTTIPVDKLELQLLNGVFGLPGGKDDYRVHSVGNICSTK